MPPTALNLVSNDYLAIAGHPDINLAQAKVLCEGESGNVMSAVFLEESDGQHLLEKRFAEWTNAHATSLTQSGYAANTGLIQSLLAGESFPVYIDLMAHMSLWDGVTIGGGTAIGFRHNDVSHLQRLINRSGPGLVIVDSVYSTSGTVCPLDDLVELATRHGCLILVDESHSLGVFGPQGSGLVCERKLENEVHFRTASLAKAFAARAGLVTFPKGYLDCFNTSSKPFIFSSALLSHEVAGLDATLTLIADSDDRRETLHRNSRYLREQLREIGLDIGASDSQIIPLVAGEEWGTITLRQELENRQLFGSPFCAPATTRKRSLLRLSVNAGLSIADCAQAVDAIRDAASSRHASDWRCYRNLKHTHSISPSRQEVAACA